MRLLIALVLIFTLNVWSSKTDDVKIYSPDTEKEFTEKVIEFNHLQYISDYNKRKELGLTEKEYIKLIEVIERMELMFECYEIPINYGGYDNDVK